MKQVVLFYVFAVLVLSLITFLMYGWDKRQAKQDGWRVPEKRIHLFTLLGGWPGALLGKNYFRHKTQNWQFKWSIILAAVLHATLVIGVCWNWLS